MLLVWHLVIYLNDPIIRTVWIHVEICGSQMHTMHLLSTYLYMHTYYLPVRFILINFQGVVIHWYFLYNFLQFALLGKFFMKLCRNINLEVSFCLWCFLSGQVPIGGVLTYMLTLSFHLLLVNSGLPVTGYPMTGMVLRRTASLCPLHVLMTHLPLPTSDPRSNVCPTLRS